MIIFSNTNAQFSMDSRARITLTSNSTDWTSAFKIYVPTYNSCAYNLNYNGSDKFFVHASGYLWCSRGGYFGSDSTMKENIKKIESPLTKLKKLNGIEFNYKYSTAKGEKVDPPNSYKKEQRLGLIAQEVQQVFPGIVKDMPDSSKAISYTDLIAVLIESIKEQQNQIETLQSVVYLQEKDLLKLKENYEKCCSDDEKSKLKSANIDNTTSVDNPSIDSDIALLNDNTPNPFSENTEIQFYIPESANNSSLIIYDLQGIEIKSFSIDQKGNGTKIIYGSELRAGMYLYTLLIDGKIIDTKRMILTHE